MDIPGHWAQPQIEIKTLVAMFFEKCIHHDPPLWMQDTDFVSFLWTMMLVGGQVLEKTEKK